MKKIASLFALVLGLLAATSCQLIEVHSTYFYQISIDESFVTMANKKSVGRGYNVVINEYLETGMTNAAATLSSPQAGYKETFAAKEGSKKVKLLFYFGDSAPKWYPNAITLIKGETVKITLDNNINFVDQQPA